MIDDLFHLKHADHLRDELDRLGLDLPVDDDFSPLEQSLNLRGKRTTNRLCVQPMEGADATPCGAPGRLTFRRYARYAGGGAGLLWVEATAMRLDATANPAQLRLDRDTVHEFEQLVSAMRAAAAERTGANIILFLQLTHPGRHSQPEPIIARHCPHADGDISRPPDRPLVDDDYLDALRDTYIEAARLAFEAGFDGVDIKSCHGDLTAELLTARSRPGKYGGSFENRCRFLLTTLAGIRATVPGLLLATRTSAYDGHPQPCGFGVHTHDARATDLEEPIRLAGMLRDGDVSLVNVSVSVPPPSPGKSDHPLGLLGRQLEITRKIQAAVPDLPIVGGGFSWLRHLLPHVAAGAVRRGDMTVVGLGRSALAYPDAPRDLLETGHLDPVKCCIMCNACYELIGDGAPAGCVIRDDAVYAPEYRHRRRYAPAHLRDEARRCHDCETAMCTAACPTHIDVPAFIKAFADGETAAAYAVIRRANVLPEMCSHLCPAWMQCEGACIENTLSGNPIPIRDIQYAVCWSARSGNLTGMQLPRERTGKRVAVVGGGPAGVAGAVGLLEKGHRVVIFERDEGLGGTPEQLIRAGRFPGARSEMDAVLQPALAAGSLEIRREQALGEGLTLGDLRDRFAAVLLATGLWQEQSLGPVDGVIDALTFLREVKDGRRRAVPARVALLSGGDCAMDAAVLAKELGALDLYIVYGGSLAEMHWHMPGDWLRTSGAHCMTLTRPQGYALDTRGVLQGVRIIRTDYGRANACGTRALVDVPGSDSVLCVDMVIEAMGLQVSDALRSALDGIELTPHGLVAIAGGGSFATCLKKVYAVGGLVNGGASVVQCIAEGMQAAREINRALGCCAGAPG